MLEGCGRRIPIPEEVSAFGELNSICMVFRT
jgi:hypothetical protein